MATDLAERSLASLFRLDGKVAVVTGGAHGIGSAIARRMSEAGATVAVGDVDGRAAESLAGELAQAHDRSALGAVLDVTAQAAVESFADLVVERHGGLDVWVNNAGIFPRQDPLDVTSADFARVLDVNVIGTQFGMAAAVARMRMAGAKGVILNLASTAGFRGAGAYSGSKWAVRGLTSGLGNVLGPEGIRVVAMAPTVTATPGITAWTGADDGGGMVERVVAGIPLGRMGEPDDVARLAVFLASDAAAFITATTVVVDGGSLASL